MSTQSLNPPDPANAWTLTLVNLQSYFHKAIEKLGLQLDSEDEKLRAKAIELVLKYFAKIDRLQARLDHLAAEGLTPTSAETQQVALARDMARINAMEEPELLDLLQREMRAGPGMDSLWDLLLSPDDPSPPASTKTPPPVKRGPGRPRKSGH